VLNRQEELRQAELRKVQAMIDWHKSETVVQALTATSCRVRLNVD